jgi:LacI family repressor for deo operon, udp, cdd, tsx, nupC, and nupG
MTKRSSTTIRDVAARAGVSHQTVSRVINKVERVSPDTKSRVETAIAELGYQPNAIAQFMARGNTTTLACLSPNLTDYTFASIIEGAETALREHGWYLISASAPDEVAFQTLVQQLVGTGRIEGLIVINPFADRRHEFLPSNFPMVFVGSDPKGECAGAVRLDDFNVGCMATRHLVNLGHRKIATITGPLRENCSQERLLGYRDTLLKHNLTPDPLLELEGDWSATSGHDLMLSILSTGTPLSAVFAQNDRMAIGAIHALNEVRLSVPEDISVIGVDDMPLAS